MTITIEITSDGISAGLARVQAALDNTLPLMDQLGEYLVDSTKRRFPTGRAPDGSVWAPKSPVTIARQGGRRTNRLDTRPLFGESKRLSGEISHEALPDQVLWGSPVEYAAVQQFGAAKGAFGAYSGIDKNGRRYSGVAPWGNIPARPFLGLSAEDEANVLDIIADYVAIAAGEPR